MIDDQSEFTNGNANGSSFFRAELRHCEGFQRRGNAWNGWHGGGGGYHNGGGYAGQTVHIGSGGVHTGGVHTGGVHNGGGHSGGGHGGSHAGGGHGGGGGHPH